MKLRVTQDLFFICQRLREIDPKYYVVFDPKLEQYELFSSANNQHSAKLLTCPFKQLDARFLSLVRQTRVERENQLIKELDSVNNSLLRKKAQQIITNTASVLSKIN